MFHYFESITNTSGDALIGYYVQALDSSSGDVVDIYADSSGTAINTASGVDNMAAVDNNGNVSFYIPGGTYDLRIYATDATTFVLAMDDVQMVDFATRSTTGIGYAVGAGGTVTQTTSRSTGVTLNALSGQITLFSAAGSSSWSTFVVTNNQVNSTDTVSLSVHGGSNFYIAACNSVSDGSFAVAFMAPSGTATDAPVINFNIIKGVSA